MIALGYHLRKLGLNTHLQSESEVYSGRTDLFLAGVERTMEQDATIGVHSWSDGSRDAADFPRDSLEHEFNRKNIEDMLGDDDFYWFTIHAAPADSMHIMSLDRLCTQTQRLDLTEVRTNQTRRRGSNERIVSAIEIPQANE